MYIAQVFGSAARPSINKPMFPGGGRNKGGLRHATNNSKKKQPRNFFRAVHFIL